MKKLIAIAALALISAHASADDKLTYEQACNLGYISSQCEAAVVEQIAAAPANQTQSIVMATLSQVNIPYLNQGYFGDGE